MTNINANMDESDTMCFFRFNFAIALFIQAEHHSIAFVKFVKFTDIIIRYIPVDFI